MTTTKNDRTQYATVQEAMAASPREMIATDGHGTCRWHRQHEHYIEHIVPLLPCCSICGGIMHDLRQTRHEVCRLRERDGKPTPDEGYIRKCPCASCRRADETPPGPCPPFGLI